MNEPDASVKNGASHGGKPAAGEHLQPASRIIRTHEYRRMPWSNGAGWTSEVLREPASDDWRWRISIADVAVAAPFSSLPGVERELVLLSGNGLRLQFDDGQVCELRPPHEGLRFAGERPLSGAPIDGPSRDFNLMWKRDHIDAQLWRRPLAGTTVLFVELGETWMVHMLSGQGQFAEGDGLGTLAAGDTAILGGSGDGRSRFALDASGEALVARLRAIADIQAGRSASG